MPNSVVNQIHLPNNTLVDINDNRIKISSPANGEMLVYDSNYGKWVNRQVIPSQTGHSGEYLTTNGTDVSWQAVCLNDLDNVNITNPTNGQTLVYNITSQKWINGSGSGSGSGITTLTSPVRIWSLAPGLYILPPSCTVYYNGASSTNSVVIYGGILNVYYGYSNTLKRWDCWEYNGNTSSLSTPGNRYAGSTTSSSGNCTNYTYITSQRNATNAGSYDFGQLSSNIKDFNTITSANLANGSVCGYITNPCANKPVNLTLSGNTYFCMFVHNSYNAYSYTSLGGYYIRQDLFFPTLNKHYYRLLQYSSTITPNTSITGADSAGWVELLEAIPSLTGNAGKVMKVNSSGTGVEWGNGVSAISELTDVNLGTLANGNILQYDSSTLKWVNSPVPSGTVPSPTTANTYLYSPDGTNLGWSTISSIAGHNYTHQPYTGTPISGSQTITYAANTRGSKTVAASGNLTLDFIVNNGADNLLWIINNSGSTIDIAINSVTSNNVIQSIFLPENGIDVDNGYVCEIGVIVNADGAYITFRNDLVWQQ